LGVSITPFAVICGISNLNKIAECAAWRPQNSEKSLAAWGAHSVPPDPLLAGKGLSGPTHYRPFWPQSSHYLQVNWKTLIAFCVDSRNRQQPQHGLQQPQMPLQPQPMAVGASPVYNEIGFERKNEQYEIPVLKAASAEPHIYDNLIHQ